MIPVFLNLKPGYENIDGKVVWVCVPAILEASPHFSPPFYCDDAMPHPA